MNSSFLAIAHVFGYYITTLMPQGMAINKHPLARLNSIFVLPDRARESPTQELEV